MADRAQDSSMTTTQASASDFVSIERPVNLGGFEVHIWTADGTSTVLAKFPSRKQADDMATTLKRTLRTWDGFQ